MRKLQFDAIGAGIQGGVLTLLGTAIPHFGNLTDEQRQICGVLAVCGGGVCLLNFILYLYRTHKK